MAIWESTGQFRTFSCGIPSLIAAYNDVMRIAITADLHFGHHRFGDEAARLMHEELQRQHPDLLLLGGDIGSDKHFDECLAFFRDLPCPKALVPGNHDIWVTEQDQRGDSLRVYQYH